MCIFGLFYVRMNVFQIALCVVAFSFINLCSVNFGLESKRDFPTVSDPALDTLPLLCATSVREVVFSALMALK